MTLLLMMTGNFCVFLICLMGAQSCYFKRKWKWFWLMTLCVIISSAYLGFEACLWLNPSARTSSTFLQPPLSPL
jgi:hypothetical protein